MNASLGGLNHIPIIVQIVVSEVWRADNYVLGILIGRNAVDYPHSLPKVEEAVVRQPDGHPPCSRHQYSAAGKSWGHLYDHVWFNVCCCEVDNVRSGTFTPDGDGLMLKLPQSCKQLNASGARSKAGRNSRPVKTLSGNAPS